MSMHKDSIKLCIKYTWSDRLKISDCELSQETMDLQMTLTGNEAENSK